MINATRSIASPPCNESGQPALDWATAVTQFLMQAQRIQLEALVSWQQSIERTFAVTNNELWDTWMCRWTGGVPIDG